MANTNTPRHQTTTREVDQGCTPCSIHDHQAANVFVGAGACSSGCAPWTGSAGCSAITPGLVCGTGVIVLGGRGWESWSDFASPCPACPTVSVDGADTSASLFSSGMANHVA